MSTKLVLAALVVTAISWTGYVYSQDANDGGWSDWGNWMSCSASCGGGTTKRYRGCDNPRPDLQGKLCLLSGGLGRGIQDIESTSCNTQECYGSDLVDLEKRRETVRDHWYFRSANSASNRGNPSKHYFDHLHRHQKFKTGNGHHHHHHHHQPIEIQLENDQWENVDCDGGKTVKIFYAVYDIPSCGYQADVTKYLKNACEGQRKCWIEANIVGKGWHCQKDSTKYLKVKLQCVTRGRTRKEHVPGNGHHHHHHHHHHQPIEYQLENDQWETIDCDGGKTIKIFYARYGSPKCGYEDVTEYLKNYCEGERTCWVLTANLVAYEQRHCQDSTKYLQFKLQCVTTGRTRKEHVPDGKELYLKQGRHDLLECDYPLYSIRVYGATYGSGRDCGGNDDVTVPIAKDCNGLNKCHVKADHGKYQNKCNRSYGNVLTVFYKCVPKTRRQQDMIW